MKQLVIFIIVLLINLEGSDEIRPRLLKKINLILKVIFLIKMKIAHHRYQFQNLIIN